MISNNEKETLHQALNRIQRELKAPKGQENSFGHYRYRSCEDILEAVKPLLGETTVTLSDEIVQFPVAHAPQIINVINSKNQVVQELVGGDRFYIKATASIHLEKDFISVFAYARESLEKKGMDTAQIIGATSSYARKYALNGLFLIDDTKDADSQDNLTTGQTKGNI